MRIHVIILLGVGLAILSLNPSHAHAQGGNCLCLPTFADTLHHGHNLDSAMVDTCGMGVSYCEIAAERATTTEPNRIYARYGYFIEFTVPAILLPAVPTDSIVEVMWEDIDTTFMDLREGLGAFEILYGSFVLRKRDVHDSTSQVFELRLSEYKGVELVIAALNTIPHVEAHYSGGFLFLLSVGNDEEECPVKIEPNPARNLLTISSSKEIKSIQLFDYNGRSIVPLLIGEYTPSYSVLDLSLLPNGVYYLVVDHSIHPVIVRR